MIKELAISGIHHYAHACRSVRDGNFWHTGHFGGGIMKIYAVLPEIETDMYCMHNVPVAVSEDSRHYN